MLALARNRLLCWSTSGVQAQVDRLVLIQVEELVAAVVHVLKLELGVISIEALLSSLSDQTACCELLMRPCLEARDAGKWMVLISHASRVSVLLLDGLEMGKLLVTVVLVLVSNDAAVSSLTGMELKVGQVIRAGRERVVTLDSARESLQRIEVLLLLGKPLRLEVRWRQRVEAAQARMVVVQIGVRAWSHQTVRNTVGLPVHELLLLHHVVRVITDRILVRRRCHRCGASCSCKMQLLTQLGRASAASGEFSGGGRTPRRVALGTQ